MQMQDQLTAGIAHCRAITQQLADIRQRVEGEALTDEELRDELMTLLVAGQETSAILLG